MIGVLSHSISLESFFCGYFKKPTSAVTYLLSAISEYRRTIKNMKCLTNDLCKNSFNR